MDNYKNNYNNDKIKTDCREKKGDNAISNEKECEKNNLLSTQIGPISLPNPVILASGTCGYGLELIDLIDISSIGAIAVKGLSLLPRVGNPPPRIIETPCGLLNAIGLENVGIDDFLKRLLPIISSYTSRIIINILGDTALDYARLAKIIEENRDDAIIGIEVNISCPNVKEGGIAFGRSSKGAREVTGAVRGETGLPLIVKLSPNVADIVEIASSVQEAGADAVSLINTVLGMAIDIRKRRSRLSNIFGGLSGPCIRPIALRMVWEVTHSLSIPVIGVGGITSWRDAVEFFMAGASAVQVGTATLIEPDTGIQIIKGLERFMIKEGYNSVKDMKI